MKKRDEMNRERIKREREIRGQEKGREKEKKGQREKEREGIKYSTQQFMFIDPTIERDRGRLSDRDKGRRGR